MSVPPAGIVPVDDVKAYVPDDAWPTGSVKLNTAGELPPVKVTVSVRFTDEKHATVLSSEIWYGVVLFAVAPAARFGYAEFACVMDTPGVVVERTALIAVAGPVPALVSGILTELHSFGSSKPLPVVITGLAADKTAVGTPLHVGNLKLPMRVRQLNVPLVW